MTPTESPRLRVFSFGGGRQSMAALVLAAQGRLDFHTFAFCNVGDDSENPATLDYYREHAIPFAARHGLDLIELHRQRRDGTPETLLGRIHRVALSVPIPARMANGAPGNRQCTIDFKVRLVDKWLKAQGAVKRGAEVGLGISLDESHRMRDADPEAPWKRLAYPLVDLRLRAADCVAIVREAGLPEPPRSSCWFCPFHTLGAWAEQRRTRPDLFEQSVALERTINEKRAKMGRDPVFFTSRLVPLDEAITGDQTEMFDSCESGYCMT